MGDEATVTGSQWRVHNASTYRRGCRCDTCRQANTDKCARLRRQRTASAKEAADRVPHGVGGYINWGCRCEVCYAAQSEANAAQRRREPREDKHGTYLNYTRGCRCDQCVAVGNPSGQPRMPAGHGISSYRKRGCRCEVCVRAASEYRTRAEAQPIKEDGHGTVLNYRRGCKCDPCRAAAAAVTRRHGRKTGWASTRKAARVRQIQSLDHARNYGKEWTGPELEVLARSDLSVTAAARLLGRTVYAVRTKRRMIRKDDPRTLAMLGKLYR